MIGIDMPMPRTCSKCDFYESEDPDKWGLDMTCNALGMRFKDPQSTRHEMCPLINLSQYEDDGK